MTYSIYIKKEAQKALTKISKIDRRRLMEKIDLLGLDPDNPILDIKKLQGEPFYRLRVGGWRVIFDMEKFLRIISIEKIKPRGGAYK